MVCVDAERSCEDPESFVSRGPTLTPFFIRRIQVPLKADYNRAASETPLNGVSLACR